MNLFFFYVSEHLNGSSAIGKNSPASNTLMDESQEYLAGVNNFFFFNSTIKCNLIN